MTMGDRECLPNALIVAKTKKKVNFFGKGQKEVTENTRLYVTHAKKLFTIQLSRLYVYKKCIQKQD